MAFALRIPPALHSAIPTDASVSSVVRQLVATAVDDPNAVATAFANRVQFEAPAKAKAQCYTIYMPDAEREAGEELAGRLLLSLNQMVQVLIEDELYREGRWPAPTQP